MLQVVNSFALLHHLMLIIIRLIGYDLEQFINIFLRDGRGLHIVNGFARLDPVRYHLAFFYLPTILAPAALLPVATRALIAQVFLVSDEDDWRKNLTILFLLLKAAAIAKVVLVHALKEIIAPHVDAFVAFAISQIKDDDATIGAAIERVTQALESLLARRIPNLNGYNFT